MKVIIEHINEIIDDNWHGGGYCNGKNIYLSNDLPLCQRKFWVTHEVLCHYLHGRIKHSKLDDIAKDIIDCQRQVEPVDMPDNKDA